MHASLIVIGVILLGSTLAWAGDEPRIAVANLAYEEKVSHYFRIVNADAKSSVKSNSTVRDTPSRYRERNQLQAEAESSYSSVEGTYTYIDRGELRNYTADLKGAIINGGGLRVTEARPYRGKDTEKVFDVIRRIKQGDFPNADYVLFGIVNNIEFQNESIPLQETTSVNHVFSLNMAVEFSLINTKTYAVDAAFTAVGSGQDVKIFSVRKEVLVPNRSRIVNEASKALATNAYGQLQQQFAKLHPEIEFTVLHEEITRNASPASRKDGPVMIYK